MEKGHVVTVEIFDPPMCCPSGLCGPEIDPVLLDIQETLLKLQRDFDGEASVERYLLSQQPARFMQNPEVLALLKRDGVTVLPITAIDGQIAKAQSYPTFQELKEWIVARRTPHGQL